MISLYLSDDRIRLVEGAIKSKKFYIKKLIELESTSGSIETGNVKNVMELSQAIQNILNDNQIKPQKTYVVIDNSRIVFKEKDVPALPHKKIKLILMNEYSNDSKQKNVVVDYIIDSKYIDETDKSKKYKLHITYQTSTAIASISKTCKEVGLKLSTVDIAQNATSKLFSTLFTSLIPGTVYLIDYKDSFLSLYVFENGQRKYSKSSVVYAKPASDKFGDNDSFISELQANITGITRYYMEKNPSATIEGVYLTGNITVFDESVVQKLANSTKLKVSYLPCPDSVVGIDINDFNKFNCPIGAMIRRNG